MRTLPQLQATQPFLTDGGLETTPRVPRRHRPARLRGVPAARHRPRAAARCAATSRRTSTSPHAAAPGSFSTRRPGAPTSTGGHASATTPSRLAAVNRRAVEFVAALAGDSPTVTAVVNGVIGPRGDGYVVGATMSAAEAAAYHGLQARAFAEAGAEMISAITMTYPDEAIGIARAAGGGQPPRGDLVHRRDRRPAALRTDDRRRDRPSRRRPPTAAPAYYMVNCAHPTHFIGQLDAAAELGRRASRASGPTPPRSATPSSTPPPSSTAATSPNSPSSTPSSQRAHRPSRRSAAAAAPTTNTSPQSRAGSR